MSQNATISIDLEQLTEEETLLLVVSLSRTALFGLAKIILFEVCRKTLDSLTDEDREHWKKRIFSYSEYEMQQRVLSEVLDKVQVLLIKNYPDLSLTASQNARNELAHGLYELVRHLDPDAPSLKNDEFELGGQEQEDEDFVFDDKE